MKTKTCRQGLRTSVKELRKLADVLEKQQQEMEKKLGTQVGDRFQINIINKIPECSDSWRFE